MISFLIDFIVVCIIAFITVPFVQLKTGFLTNRKMELFGYTFEVKGEKGKSVSYWWGSK